MFEKIFNQPLLLDFEISTFLLVSFLIMLVFICYHLIFSKRIFKNILLLSAYSILISLCYLIMDAPDVAMTEVALGSCLSTCVLLNFAKMIDSENSNDLKLKNIFPATILCSTFAAILAWTGFELPIYGASTAPVHEHVGKYYLENTIVDTGIPAPVTAVLASYRGFDTLGETTVILIAGVAVLLVFSIQNVKHCKINKDEKAALT